MKKFAFYLFAVVSLVGSVPVKCVQEPEEQQQECGQVPKRTVAQWLYTHKFKIAALTGIVLMVVAYGCNYRLAPWFNHGSAVQDLDNNIKQLPPVADNVIGVVLTPISADTVIETVTLPVNTEPVALPVHEDIVTIPSMAPTRDENEIMGDTLLHYAGQAQQKVSAYVKAAIDYWKQSVIDQE